MVVNVSLKEAKFVISMTRFHIQARLYVYLRECLVTSISVCFSI